MATVSEHRVSKSQLQSISWGKKYTWDCIFANNSPPSPFDKVFPAISFEYTHSSLGTQTIKAGTFSMEVPSTTTNPKVSITFLDDSKGTLFSYMRTWFDAVSSPNGTLPIGEASRLLVYKKYDKQFSKVLESRELLIFPTGDLQDADDSSADTKQFTVSFVVANSKISK